MSLSKIAVKFRRNLKKEKRNLKENSMRLEMKKSCAFASCFLLLLRVCVDVMFVHLHLSFLRTGTLNIEWIIMHLNENDP
jgi:hypothetical protein